MKFPAILVQVTFLTPPGPLSIGQTVENFLKWIYPFRENLPPYDDYCVLICWNLGSTRLVTFRLVHLDVFERNI